MGLACAQSSAAPASTSAAIHNSARETGKRSLEELGLAEWKDFVLCS
jgi:hypothetical protein